MKSGPAYREEQVIIPQGADWLYAMLHAPASPAKNLVLICNPLFEERKSAHRVLVDMARSLCLQGSAVLRFDYRGCGDSSGSFESFSVRDWIDDIRAAGVFLKSRAPDRHIVLAGLRLGCALAMQAWRDIGAERLVLLEPILSGAEYLDQEFRKSLIKEMMTSGSGTRTGESVHDDLLQGKTVDFDGFPVSPVLYRDMAALDVSRHEAASPRKVLVVNVTSLDHLSPKLLKLCSSLKSHGSDVQASVVSEPPFWNLVDIVDSSNLIKTTTDWMQVTDEHD
ncbi:MAG: hypothetical protein C0404_08050 [Verrucomicrobia bacterium]|nr:hypothetical protein [Verrucomicrobiota bacterium]